MSHGKTSIVPSEYGLGVREIKKSLALGCSSSKASKPLVVLESGAVSDLISIAIGGVDLLSCNMRSTSMPFEVLQW